MYFDANVLTTGIMNNLQYVLLGIMAMIFIALLIFININIKLSKMNKRYQKMMQGMEGNNLEKLLIGHIEEVRHAVDKVNAMENEYKRMDALTQYCVQKIGIVRFNAFEDTGSDLSFAIALFDAKNNGVVFSSIYGRNESRTYAKPIVNGQSEYHLTNEEKEAIAKALAKN